MQTKERRDRPISCGLDTNIDMGHRLVKLIETLG